ncbi:uncharacterized protein LOC107416050 [Ziziphus jujuba]|uniref:Uncharacterized protein LOC107416050 n=2 Tax=Ziziphus jujuba TaxID=326968 RepID=A0A6P3ZLU1_ZIZJJ|nr:uncharacterized protein LOC107416050 [Ziziphus jujuba]XP_048331438.1 uncharacterized protein LOC107416050 [Ziziphus jujuba]KAH7523349.1 hypothetical protein FEM48_Zijuj06G0001400 [Ziziphus jujuba var. spinosa]
MTAEVDVYEPEGIKGSVAEEEQCGLDLAKAKDDADGSYVFVNGTDAKDDDVVEANENGDALLSHFENKGDVGGDCNGDGGLVFVADRGTFIDAQPSQSVKAVDDETPVPQVSDAKPVVAECDCESPLHTNGKVEVEDGDDIRDDDDDNDNDNDDEVVDKVQEEESKSNSARDADADEHEESHISVNNENFPSVTAQEESKSNSDSEVSVNENSPSVFTQEESESNYLADAKEHEESEISAGENFRTLVAQDKQQAEFTSQVVTLEGSTAHFGDSTEQNSTNVLSVEANSSVSDDNDIDDTIRQSTLLGIEVNDNSGPVVAAAGANDVRSEPETCYATAEGEKQVTNAAAIRDVDVDVDLEAGISNSGTECPLTEEQPHSDTLVVAASLTVDLKSASEIESTYASNSGSLPVDDGDLHNPAGHSESAVGSNLDFVQESEGIGGIDRDEAPTSSSGDNLEGQNVGQHVDTPPASLDIDLKPESEVENTCAPNTRNMPGEDGILSESNDLHSHAVDNGSAADRNLDFVHVEGDVEPTCKEAKSIDGIHRVEASTSSPEDSLEDTSVDNDGGTHSSQSANSKPESEAKNTSALNSTNMSDDNGAVSESRDLQSPVLDSGSIVDSDLDPEHVERDVKPNCQEAESIDGILRDEASASSPEDNLETQNAGIEVVKKPFYFLIRIPRSDEENLRERIKHAQLEVEEKTKRRDAIRGKIQMKRATCKEFDDAVQSALMEERAARDSVKSKRQEVDSVQLMINKVKNAISVEDIDGRIRNMEHMIEHETLPLREEKQLIREIKQLKQLREQLSLSIGKQDEIQQALGRKDQIEERLKVLRKEIDLLRDNLLKAELVTRAAKKKFNDENDELNELLSHFKAADGIRQEAYAHMQSLKKQQYEKNKYFWRYKDDVKAANNLASTGDREQLQCLCIDQVEKVMELWNRNDDFRKEYIRCNTRSTLRRLGTLDGRSLGPDEEPPVIPYIVHERVAKNNSVAPISTQEQEKQVVIVEAEKPDKSAAKIEERENQKAKTKKPAKHASLGNGPPAISGWIEIEEAREEEKKLTKEEAELARKAEELRKEEEAAKLKEQRRLEEKAKAKEALERKKRIAEKAQARAAIRAQKEAEQKQKEREKRAVKKDRKKANGTEATNGISEGDSGVAPSLEIPSGSPKESEAKEKPTALKRPQKASSHSQLTKLQTRAKPMPLPLRNRSKRRMQPWMWTLVAVALFFVLFLMGNSNLSSKSCLQWLGF